MLNRRALMLCGLSLLLAGCTVSLYQATCYRDGRVIYDGPAVRQLVGGQGVAIYDARGWTYLQAQCDIRSKD
jgi:hypothetical protein